MAEQTSHNVVNVPQSASASSPLVDAVANHTSSTFAESGNDSSTVPSTHITDASISQSTPGATAPNTQAVNAGEAAAEPSAGDAAAKSHDVPATSQPVVADGDSKAGRGVPTINGVHDNGIQGSAVEEGGSQDVSAANSDTDTSKGEALETKDGHLHVRTNSVKKPTTFSKISATKNFLAKSASTAPSVAKTGERSTVDSASRRNLANATTASPVSAASAAVAPPAAKPRLIAKTGASLRELQKARQNAESPNGPDASKVWNKNRPAAPPPPKQFTDEELKQQYGIHLATRLQSDENGKESKWADIDEDEDDWVPEAVTWIDGTKSALTPADNTPVPKEAKPAQPDAGKPAESVKPSLTALKKPTEPSGPPKTILKPGAAAAQAKQNGQPSSSPGTEKATLKAKSPAPPSKSPWATLPPVDKISPVNPPVQQIAPPVQLATQDARAYEPNLQPQQQPTREIAADTFDRSWREGEGGSRELFNSVTGQYEMAPEGRRSSRPEPFGRKPSVLQRPSQQGMNHPPEPSPAFQTRSGSQTDGPPSWARRRGSSVSQSGMPPRRMSINRGPEPFAAHERRTSTVVGHDVRTSPHDSKAEPPHGMFSQQNAWQQQMPAPPQAGGGEELEDPVKVQERIMKEKRELARKRRQEEEQEAEAARKERLKAKMAALSGAGQSRQEREAAKEAAAAAPKPVVEPTPDAIKSPLGREDKTAPRKEPEAAAAASELPSQAQVPPPTSGTSDPTGTKLPSPDKIELPASISKPDSAGLPSRSISDHLHRQVARGPLSPKANSRAPFQQAASPYHAPHSAFSSPGDRKPQPFGRSPMAGNDGFSPWPSAGSGNVWGTGSIGNGVFESSSSFAPAPMFSQQNSALPPPPGMTRPGTSARISPQGLGAESKSPSLQQNHMPEQGRAFAPPGMEGRPDQFIGQAMPNGSASSPGLGRPQRVPGPIAPPSRAQPPMQSQLSEDSKINAWRTAAQTLPAQYANASQAAALNSQEGTAPSQSNDTFRETFRQTTRGRLGGPRKADKPEFTIHDAQGSRTVSSLNPAPPSTQTQPSVPVPTASPLSHPWKQIGENTVRLPNSSMSNSHNGAPVQQPPIGPPQMRPQPAPVGTPRKAKMPSDPLPPTVDSKEQPPPPPESTNHPVFGGNAKQPHVRLPLVKPIVRLPPQSAVPIAQQPAVMMPPRQHWGPPAAMRPIVQNEAWQARFNGLFARTNITTETPPSPPKTPPKTQAPAIGVSASSRDALHEIPSTSAATVSLPHAQQTFKLKSPEGFIIDDSADVTSKDTIEQMFNEELSFGSKPLTRIPRNPQYTEAGADAKYNMFNLKPQDLPKPVDPQSKAQFNIHQVQFRNSKGCFVKMPGVKTKHNPIFWKRTGQTKGVSKPKAKALAAKENAESPAPGAAPAAANAGSRKASSQKGSTVSTPQQKSPAPTPPAAQASGNGKRGPNFKGPKGRGQNVPVKSA